MSDTLMQVGMWVAAGGIMIIFLKRRKSRKTTR
jgi:hypothetical protein